MPVASETDPESQIQVADTAMGSVEYATIGEGSGAERLTLDGGTHLAFFTHPDARAAQARAIDVLRDGPSSE